MGQIVHQGAWITSPRCVWNKRYRHHCLHQVQQNTAQQEAAHHLRKDGGYALTRERQLKSNKAHCWWYLDSASWQCKHTNGQDDDSENAFQQHDINKRSTILRLQLKRLLSQHTNGATGVYANETEQPVTRFVDLYNLTKIAEDNGNVYIKVQKGIYGLPQAGILAHRLLEQRLNEHGY
jgi:hypothetical protein